MISGWRGQRAAIARALMALFIATAAGSLAGCSSASSVLIDHVPTAVGGLPEGSPERPAQPMTYPAVHDIPPTRGPTVLTAAEKKRLQDELAATRERNVRDAAANPENIDIQPPAGAARN
jgi:hypothetical protein